MTEDLNSTFNSAQLLSIPSQQGEPPKHSTPKRPDWGDPLLELDQSSICDQMSGHHSFRSNTSSIGKEKNNLTNYFDKLDLQDHEYVRSKRMPTASASSSATKEYSYGLLNRAAVNMPSSRGPSLGGATRKVVKRDQEVPVMTSRAGSAISEAKKHWSNDSPKFLGIERGKETLDFGYVSIGESLKQRRKVWNCDRVQMQISCKILSMAKEEPPESNCFQVVEMSSPVLGPGEFCEITVQYAPTLVEKNMARLVVERQSGAQSRFSFPLVGYGGKAQLGLQVNFDTGIAMRPTSGQSINILPELLERFFLTFENEGQRPLFVFLMAIDRSSNKNGQGQEQQQLSMKPERFVVEPMGGKRANTRTNVLIRRPESMELGKSNPLMGRESILSSASTNGQSETNCPLQILAYWGEEEQRQRLKCWEKMQRQIFQINGFRFTGEFANEAPLNLKQKEKVSAATREDTDQEFQRSLRITRFNVFDHQVAHYFPVQLQPELYRFIFPDKTLLVREGDTTMMSNNSCVNNRTCATTATTPRRQKETTPAASRSRLGQTGGTLMKSSSARDRL